MTLFPMLTPRIPSVAAEGREAAKVQAAAPCTSSSVVARGGAMMPAACPPVTNSTCIHQI